MEEKWRRRGMEAWKVVRDEGGWMGAQRKPGCDKFTVLPLSIFSWFGLLKATFALFTLGYFGSVLSLL